DGLRGIVAVDQFHEGFAKSVHSFATGVLGRKVNARGGGDAFHVVTVAAARLFQNGIKPIAERQRLAAQQASAYRQVHHELEGPMSHTAGPDSIYQNKHPKANETAIPETIRSKR